MILLVINGLVFTKKQSDILDNDKSFAWANHSILR
jgi:hypothetical protein